MLGLGMIISCGILLLILGAASEPFSVRLTEDGARYVAQTSDGTECRIFETRPLDDVEADVRAMIDCGDQPGVGIIGAFQYLFLAVLAVGVVLVATGGFALAMSTWMPREMLVIPVSILGVIAGIFAIAWGLGGDGPGLVVQGLRDQATTGILRTGGAVTNRNGSVAWGIGLVAASSLRLTRT